MVGALGWHVFPARRRAHAPQPQRSRLEATMWAKFRPVGVSSGGPRSGAPWQPCDAPRIVFLKMSRVDSRHCGLARHYHRHWLLVAWLLLPDVSMPAAVSAAWAARQSGSDRRCGPNALNARRVHVAPQSGMDLRMFRIKEPRAVRGGRRGGDAGLDCSQGSVKWDFAKAGTVGGNDLEAREACAKRARGSRGPGGGGGTGGQAAKLALEALRAEARSKPNQS